jgi:hypothetical protein
MQSTEANVATRGRKGNEEYISIYVFLVPFRVGKIRFDFCIR